MNRNVLLILVGIFIGACAAGAAPAVRTAMAGGFHEHRCEYTYISDINNPNIGNAGAIEYDKEWEIVLSAGFHLKAIAPSSAYVFERCE